VSLLALAKKFERAGYALEEITEEDLGLLGLRLQKTYTTRSGRRIELDNWEHFCIFVYEKVAGESHPGCTLRGRGFRSQAFGKSVADAIRRFHESYRKSNQ
jgi:hypothetical protein